MIKKYEEFIKEGVIDNIKDFIFKKKDVYGGPVNQTPSNYPPSPEPSGEYERRTKPQFPCVYSFMTNELEEKLRKRGDAIGLRNDGYSVYCKTPQELEEAKEKYKIGNKYNGETITMFDIGQEINY